MKGLKGEEHNLEIDTIFNREPVKLLKNRNDIIYGSGNDTGRNLEQLKFDVSKRPRQIILCKCMQTCFPSEVC